jgi:hypothetical protein
VLVAVEDAVGRLEDDHASERDVLAEARRELRHVLRHGLALQLELVQLVGARVDGDARELGDRRAEIGALGHEVGLGGQLDERTDATLDQHLDCAVLGRAPGTLLRAREALLAQPVLRRFHVAARLLERALAVHHPRPGGLAQLGDELRGHLSHRCSPLLSPLVSRHLRSRRLRSRRAGRRRRSVTPAHASPR